VLINNADVGLGVDFPGGPLFIEDFNNGDTEELQYAAFVTANYDFDRFRLGGGLRVNRSEFEGVVLNPPVTTTEINDTTVLPKVTLAYDATDDVMLYANVARGLEPGKVNVVSGSGNPYTQETAWNYEIGLKGFGADRRLSFDLAAFYISYKARQFETQFLNNGVITEEITNIGDSVSYGVEAGVNLVLAEGLALTGGAGWLHAEWDDPDALFNLMPVDGNTVPFSPSVTANAPLDYRHPVGENLEIGFRADVSHTGSFFWNIPNTAEQNAYQLVNLRLSLGDADGGWELAVRGENIFDETYYNEFTPDVFGPGTGLGAPGRPATVMGSLRLAL
jgi:outer membrane receptor protein involved in Fe transport